jgi:Spy/CpxP family protein refolding chaperone
MRPKSIGRAVAALLLVGLAMPAAAQRGFPWWKDAKVVKELGLSVDQSNKIDNIFRTTYPQLRQSNTELDRQEAELSHLIAISADEATVERQIDKVEAIRASLNKTRTLMLLHMVRKLSPEQRAKFNPVHEQWRRENPRPSSGPPPAPPEPVRTPDAKGRPQTAK